MKKTKKNAHFMRVCRKTRGLNYLKQNFQFHFFFRFEKVSFFAVRCPIQYFHFGFHLCLKTPKKFLNVNKNCFVYFQKKKEIFFDYAQEMPN